jgi:ABC-type sugar transport system ATPase subunit
VPDDRKREALLPTRSVSENFSIAWNGHLSNGGMIDTRAERRMVRDAIARYGVITPSAASRITTLSGGNQQKVVLGRIFALDVDVLVLSEPTRGIDVGAKSEIYRMMQEAAAQGAAIVLISSELPELLGIADRIVVFYRGEIRGEFSGDRMLEEDIAHVAVTGASASPAPQTTMETS